MKGVGLKILDIFEILNGVFYPILRNIQNDTSAGLLNPNPVSISLFPPYFTHSKEQQLILKTPCIY